MDGYLRCLRGVLRILGVVLLGVLSHATAVAQTVWRVDGQQFSDIDSAYALAQPGDVILVSLPNAPIGSLRGKGVRILASRVGLPISAYGFWLQDVPAGQQFVLSGFLVEAGFGAFVPPMRIFNCAGSLVLEDCVGSAGLSSFGLAPLSFRNCRDVQLFGVSWMGRSAGQLGSTICTSSFGGGTAGVSFEDSRATLVRCDFTGGSSAACPIFCPFCQPSTIPGAAGISARRSSLSVHECELRGGRGSSSTGAPAREGGAVELWEGSELWISPTPTRSIFADAGTTARCFGAPPAALGTGNFISEAFALPELRVGMLGPGFRAVSSFASSGAPVFLGISLASGFAPLDPFGHLGVLEMDYDRARSALIAIGNFDGAGRYEAWLPVPPWAFSALAHQALRFQLLSLDGTGRIAVSGVDLLVLPAYG